jgi:CheY-like chemotaxis protein
MQTHRHSFALASPASAIVHTPHHSCDLLRSEAGCNILILDPNDISRQVIAITLETAGYGVLALDNARAAEKSLQRSKPDLILMSLVLADANCWELAARIRRHSTVPIVGYAGVLPPETRGEFKRGFTGFLTRPFTPAHLVRSLPFYLWNKPVPPPIAEGTLRPSSWETLNLQGTQPNEESDGASVLLVDDNQFQRERLSEAFATAGFSVSLARHGIEALEKLNLNRPTLIVSDTLMTGCDGFELCLAVHKLAALQDVRFLLTPPNQGDALDELVALALGADAYISRAGGFEQLINAAQQLSRTPTSLLAAEMATVEA